MNALNRFIAVLLALAIAAAGVIAIIAGWSEAGATIVGYWFPALRLWLMRQHAPTGGHWLILLGGFGGVLLGLLFLIAELRPLQRREDILTLVDAPEGTVEIVVDSIRRLTDHVA